jgi:hypothetical protein
LFQNGNFRVDDAGLLASLLIQAQCPIEVGDGLLVVAHGPMIAAQVPVAAGFLFQITISGKGFHHFIRNGNRQRQIEAALQFPPHSVVRSVKAFEIFAAMLAHSFEDKIPGGIAAGLIEVGFNVLPEGIGVRING